LYLLLALSGCSKTQQPTSATGASPDSVPAAKITSENVVKASTQQKEIPAGGSGEALVRINIQNGYHINANPATYSYLIETNLDVQPPEGLSIGFISYPTAVTKKFPFAEKPLAVYEGEVTLKVLLKATNSAPKGTLSLPAKLRVQACDNQVCYPPGMIDIDVPITIVTTK
jgi:thioredoxin:protein disulfide reductase